MPQNADTEFLDKDPPPLAVRGLAYVIIALFVLALVAAVIITVPETVSGQFRLLPVDGADPIRSRKDGVVSTLTAREGDTVAANGVLMVLNSSTMVDRFGDRRTLETQRRADAERLTIVQSQYDTRKRADASEKRRLETRVRALQRLLVSRQQRLKLTRELADSALAGLRSGAVNRVEAARLDLEASTLNEDVLAATNDLDETQADLVRLARDGEARDLEYREAVRALNENIETAGIRIEALHNDLQNLTDAGFEIRSPCAGTILRLNVSGPGTVIREGEVLGEIACSGRQLEAEFQIPQSGLSQVKAGQPVKLRYDAFPYQRYGVRFATVRWVGPGGLAGSSNDIASFRAVLDLAEDSIKVRGVPRPLLAGMQGRADVIVGRRSLVSYAFEPIRAVRENFAEPPQ
jgi:membrane fusion protein